MAVRKEQQNLSSDCLFKIVIIGDSGVGKSCLLVRFADDSFSENFITTIGVDFKFRTLTVEDTSAKLQIVGVIQWDTAGQERFRTITTAYYRGADGIFVVYDKTNRETFEHVDMWLDEVKKITKDQTVKILIGNKADVENPEVSQEQGVQKARLYGLEFLETSAKSAFQVDAAFMDMARQLIKSRKENGFVPDPRGPSLNQPPPVAKKAQDCCN